MSESIPVFNSAVPRNPYIDLRWQISTNNMDSADLDRLDHSLITELYEGDEEYFRSEQENADDRWFWLSLFESDFDATISNMNDWLESNADYLIYITNKYRVSHRLHIDYHIPASMKSGPSFLLSEKVLMLLQKHHVELCFSVRFFDD